MISTNDFHTGLTIDLDGEVYEVVEFQHSKSGRGGAFVRTKIKNLEEDYVVEKMIFDKNENLFSSLVGRTKHLTCLNPLSSKFSTTRNPIKPEAPVTNIGSLVFIIFFLCILSRFYFIIFSTCFVFD